jgi:hypothetical protein
MVSVSFKEPFALSRSAGSVTVLPGTPGPQNSVLVRAALLRGVTCAKELVQVEKSIRARERKRESGEYELVLTIPGRT